MLTRCNFTMYNTFDMKMTFFICKLLATLLILFTAWKGGGGHGSKSQNGLQTFISWYIAMRFSSLKLQE